jgi:hypothetical protein
METVSQRIEESAASAKGDEASRVFKIAQRTYDHLESQGYFRPYGGNLHSVGDSVLNHFQELQIKQLQTRATDGQVTGVPIVDPGSSDKSAQDDNARTHEMQDVTRDELEQVSENFYEAAKSLFLEEEGREAAKERGGQVEGIPRGRRLVRRGSRPTVLSGALN